MDIRICSGRCCRGRVSPSRDGMWADWGMGYSCGTSELGRDYREDRGNDTWKDFGGNGGGATGADA